MTTNWDAVIKQARECHTKQAWEGLFETFGETIAASGHSKPIDDLFKLLRSDSQSLLYDPKIWGSLVQGCLTSWNLELGREIAEIARKLPSAQTAIPSARLYLESGLPAVAREIANRALRLSGLSAAEKLQLEMLVASSYAEEGKRQKTIQLLETIRVSVEKAELGMKERADFLSGMGRMQYFLGRYVHAGEVFYDASKLYRALRDWEAAAKSIFNTAACHLNAGIKQHDEAFVMIEECRRLAEAENLPGPLSHCEAAYGLDAYQHGNFAAAREHLRRALDHLPISDKSYRRLHILSMLAFTYLAMGRFHLARKFGRQTFDLAALDESDRNKSRYTNLQAELLWEEGLVDESQALLKTATAPFESNGVHTLEELSTLTRLCAQSAMLGKGSVPTRHSIDESLHKNHHAWLDRVQSLGQLALNSGDYADAEKHFLEVLNNGRQVHDRYHEATGLLGLTLLALTQRHSEVVESYCRDFEIVVGRIGETPLKAQVLFLQSALAYQTGSFAECERLLRQAAKSTRLCFADRFVLACWMATLEGRSTRLTGEWQTQLVARYTRTYFAPSIEAVDARHFKVSQHYLISLERHPALAELLHYLLSKTNFSATTSEVQSQVWKQSLHTQGWQQKIRNTIMRLRDFFPHTIAPLIVHEGQISLFREAIEIHAVRQDGLGPTEEIVRLLEGNAMSSLELAQRLKVSSATAKRLLKKLLEDRQVQATKKGRHVYYSAAGATG